MNHTIRQGTEQDRNDIADTVVKSFWSLLSGLGESQQSMVSLLSDMMQPERFTVAVDDAGAVVGAAAVGDESGYPIQVQPALLKKQFGFIKGTMAAKALADEVHRPRAFKEGEATISLVSVREDARGQGIAKDMMRYILNSGKYRLYTLDVIEGNEQVLPLYEGLGFRHTHKEKEKGAAMKGFNFRYMMAFEPEGKA